MKRIQYSYLGNDVQMLHTDANEQIAKEEADLGVYSVVECEDEAMPLTLEERVLALEKTVTVEPFVAGKWYYRGDKVSFEGATYTCVAPEGAVCVWSPGDYPVYWEKN